MRPAQDDKHGEHAKDDKHAEQAKDVATSAKADMGANKQQEPPTEILPATERRTRKPSYETTQRVNVALEEVEESNADVLDTASIVSISVLGAVLFALAGLYVIRYCGLVAALPVAFK